jgi:diguanylate cyclase (GGDEF)-like protein
MYNGVVIVIRNRLEGYLDIVGEFSKNSSFETKVATYKGLLGGDHAGALSDNGTLKCFILLEKSFFHKVKDELGEYVRSLTKEAFGNYLLLYGGPKRPQAEQPSPVRMERCFFLSSEENPGTQAFYLGQHMEVLFESAMLSDRLNRYISDAFKVVVYSELINKKNKEIEILNKELEIKNRIDNLTNLYNRSALFDFLEQERKRTVRELWRLQHARPPLKVVESSDGANKYGHEPQGTILDHLGVFTIMMIDLDHFKKINDTYGHLAGDDVLRAFGNLFLDKQILRGNDIAGRFGGEEFIVILPETNAQNAMDPAQRLSDAFGKIEFTANNGARFNVTISVGISEYNPKDQSCEEIVARADKALYYAKDQGRNRIVVYEKVFA